MGNVSKTYNLVKEFYRNKAKLKRGRHIGNEICREKLVSLAHVTLVDNPQYKNLPVIIGMQDGNSEANIKLALEHHALSEAKETKQGKKICENMTRHYQHYFQKKQIHLDETAEKLEESGFGMVATGLYHFEKAKQDIAMVFDGPMRRGYRKFVHALEKNAF